MSPAAQSDGSLEARFDRSRRTLGLFLGPVVFLLVLWIPSSLEPAAHRLAAVFSLVIVFWITEAIPLPATALLGPALTVPLGIAGAKEAFACFGHPIIFLFMGSFLIAGAMREHGLDRRIALFVLSRRWVGDRPGRILLAFGGIAAFLSMWMSNTATTAMMLPIGLGVLRTLPRGDGEEGQRGVWGYATGLMLMIAFSCNIGGIATPVGTPPNLIAQGMLERILGRDISFFDWMTLAVPIALACFIFLFALLRWTYVGKMRAIRGATAVIVRERQTLGRWKAGEKAALLSFLLAVFLWTLPGFVDLVSGRGSDISRLLKAALPEGPCAILAAVTLFLFPVDWPSRRFALHWRHAAKIDWGTILLFGGGLSLGSLAFSTGLAKGVGDSILNRSGALSIAVLALVAAYTANIMTEFMSNTATANLLIPMFLAVTAGAAEPSIVPALAATLGCSLAFCLPVATPPNAIVYGSGHVPITKMIRMGIVLDVVCGVLVWAGVVLLAGRL